MQIKLYTTTTCQPCRLVANKFTAHGVAFEKITLDMEENADLLAGLKARLGADTLHTPLLEVDGAVAMQGLTPGVVAQVIADYKEAAQ